MIRYCLDTSAYGRFMTGDSQVVGHLDAADWVGIPAVVLGELWAGFLGGGRLQRNLDQLAELLAHPVVEEVAVDSEVARLYGEIVVALRRAGTPLPTNDVWIAACAARSGAAVLTFDGHFRRVERVGSVVLAAR